jgi:hypothetical protein
MPLTDLVEHFDIGRRAIQGREVRSLFPEQILDASRQRKRQHLQRIGPTIGERVRDTTRNPHERARSRLHPTITELCLEDARDHEESLVGRIVLVQHRARLLWSKAELADAQGTAGIRGRFFAQFQVNAECWPFVVYAVGGSGSRAVLRRIRIPPPCGPPPAP